MLSEQCVVERGGFIVVDGLALLGGVARPVQVIPVVGDERRTIAQGLTDLGGERRLTAPGAPGDAEEQRSRRANLEHAVHSGTILSSRRTDFSELFHGVA